MGCRAAVVVAVVVIANCSCSLPLFIVVAAAAAFAGAFLMSGTATRIKKGISRCASSSMLMHKHSV